MPMSLNPRLKERLPDILEAIHTAVNDAETPLKEACLAVSELQDYLDFEIKKISLEVDKIDWECVVAPGLRDQLEERRRVLLDIQQAVAAEAIMESITLLNGLAERITTQLQTEDQPAASPSRSDAAA